MNLQITIACPGCQAMLNVQGQAGAAIQVACPKCGQQMSTTIPAAGAQQPASSAPQQRPVQRPRQPAASQSPSAGGFGDFPSVPTQTFPPNPSQNAATRKKSAAGKSSKGIIVGLAVTCAAVLLAGGGWLLFSVAFGENNTPEGIVEDYFDMLMASEEPRENYGAAKGTSEYETRIQRYLKGDELSRDLLTRAMRVDGTGNKELYTAYAKRAGEFAHRYQFGIPAQELQDNEGALLADPRLDVLKWKDILERYMQESFFGIDERRDSGWAKSYFNYVQTLGEVAREISQIESVSDTDGMEARLAPKIDEIIEYAANSANDVMVLVNRNDKRRETTFFRMIDAYVGEFRDKGIESDELNNALSDYWVATGQVSRPVSANANRVRAVLAENRAKREPGYKSPEEKKAEEAAAKLAAKQAEEPKQRDPTLGEHFQNSRDRGRGRQPQPETMANSDAQSSSRSEPAEVGSGPPEGFDPRRGPRFGPPSGFGGPPPGFGQPRGPGGMRERPAPPTFDGPDRIEIVINGGNPHDVVQEFVKKLGIKSFSYRGRGNTATLLTSDSRTAKELAAEIDFGEVTDISGRVITVKYADN